MHGRANGPNGFMCLLAPPLLPPSPPAYNTSPLTSSSSPSPNSPSPPKKASSPSPFLLVYSVEEGEGLWAVILERGLPVRRRRRRRRFGPREERGGWMRLFLLLVLPDVVCSPSSVEGKKEGGL